MSSDEDLRLRQQLRDLGRRRRELTEAQRILKREMAETVRHASTVGVSITTISQDTGLSRQAVYTILGGG